MLIFVLALAVDTVAGLHPLTVRPEVQISGSVVHLADVVDLSPLPPALLVRASQVPVTQLRATDQTLSSREVFARARAAVPMLADWLPDRADQAIHVRVIGGLDATPVSIDRSAARAQRPAIEAGDKLTVRAQVGPVRVDRDVVALQSGRAGHRMFVRTADGAVLSVRVGPDQ